MSQDYEQTYTQRVMQAYAEIAAERQTPDVPVHALYQRIGGSLPELHDWLRQECRAHHCVPTTGEPAFASEEAKRTALTLNQPGASETFLNVKLLDMPTVTQQQQPQQPEVGRMHELEAFVQRVYDSHGKMYDGQLYEESKRLMTHAQRPEHERYEGLLRATAALRYPMEERTAELSQRIEVTIQRKVSTFIEERQAKAQQREQQQDLSRRPDPARQKGQGRGMGMEH
jgi:hypothetical protein